VEYYYDIVNLCRLVDPYTSEALKLGHLFDGLRPTFVERIWMAQPKTCEEFLTTAKLLLEVAEVVGQGSWSVNLLAKQGEAESMPTLKQLFFKLADHAADLENRLSLQEGEVDDEMQPASP
jgi:hypothetical protein